MAHRSKQDKPCPNTNCSFPTLNRQSQIHRSQLKEIAQIDPGVLSEILEANICSSCGCVYTGQRKHKWIVGYHDDPLVEDRDSDEAIWWTPEDE